MTNDWDVDDSVSLVQNIGQVETKNGRCIVFPNIYQHQVGGFKLVDPTKPGHRKIFTFFFIDPSTRIPSTEIVPPQQQNWWTDKVSDTKPICNLPGLAQKTIYDNVPFPLSLSEAETIRLDLMAERTQSNNNTGEELLAPEFSMGEH